MQERQSLKTPSERHASLAFRRVGVAGTALGHFKVKNSIVTHVLSNRRLGAPVAVPREPGDRRYINENSFSQIFYVETTYRTDDESMTVDVCLIILRNQTTR